MMKNTFVLILIWIAISNRGMSKTYFRLSKSMTVIDIYLILFYLRKMQGLRTH